jgi:EmrB/QacA subfamily drug resistance transporter
MSELTPDPHLLEPTDDHDADAPDPRRWVTLGIVITAAFIVVLDNSILNVAIPTIMRDFDTTLPSLQWVVTGYALTFATFLIVGGRLGDVYGHRRIFIIGAALFGVGSLIAALSQGVPALVFGEAVIEGLGASLMLPSTLAILSGTFRGRERVTAFAMWGATAGVGAAFGPVIGGFLTTNYSWRWAFIINVIVAPIAIVGAMLFMKRGQRSERQLSIDIPGAALIAVGMFLLVLALSEGGRYGWITPLQDFTIGNVVVWPETAPIAITPVLILISACVLYAFVRLERSKERRDASPLFEFSHLALPTFRNGLITAMVISMGQLGVVFVLPLFLQDGKHLTAAENGYWMLPTGLFIILGAQLGGRLGRRVGPTVVVRVGVAMEAIGIVLVALVISPDITALHLVPGFAMYGMGIGFAAPQLTNVVLSQIPDRSTGVASGANATVRQVGSALGVAIIGALVTAQTAKHGLATGTQVALAFAAVVVGVGAVFSFMIPREVAPADADTERINAFEPLEPMDVPRSLIEQ